VSRQRPRRPLRGTIAIAGVASALLTGAPVAGAVLPQSGIAPLLTQTNVRTDGQQAMDAAGGAVAHAGDVNGDGREDVIVGAENAGNNARANSGSAYVVFGTPDGGGIDLRSPGASGFRIDGAAATDLAGGAVGGGGDYNGDGLDDVIVGAQAASTGGRMGNGAAYVVFGKRDAGTVDLSALGGRGVRIDGAADNNQAGFAVAGVGDMNGDRRPEVVLSAFDAGNNGRAQSGSAYVVFGKASTARVDLAALGASGFRIDGAGTGDRAGEALDTAGDVNGDGRADVVVGAFEADPFGRANAGSAWVVFGAPSTARIDLRAPGARAFRVAGSRPDDFAGDAVAGAGDANSDGLADIVVGARGADDNGRADSGSAYIVFGSRSAATLDTRSLGTRGFSAGGARSNDLAGTSVGRAGDHNSDGLDDVLVGAPSAGNAGAGSGSGYLLFGRRGAARIDLADVGANGVRVDGEQAMDQSSESLAGGFDFSGDGAPDAIIGAPGADHGRAGSGSAYVLFGALRAGFCANRREGTRGNDLVVGTALGDRLLGFGGADRLLGGASRDCLLGGAGNDRLAGETGNDRLRGEAGRDRLAGGSGRDRLAGGLLGDRIFGGRDNDRLFGGRGNDRLSGEAGRDRLRGEAGRDRLRGGLGRDRLAGGSGRDRLRGGPASDIVGGGSGADRLSGGAARDLIIGGSGNDRINAIDGRRDRIRCGRGRDRVLADRADAVAGCERVRRL